MAKGIYTWTSTQLCIWNGGTHTIFSLFAIVFLVAVLKDGSISCGYLVLWGSLSSSNDTDKWRGEDL